MTEPKFIRISGARQHNLKNLSVSLPKGRLTVITGVSGSGKSSLAFDTLYAEGQRRYVESLSTHAQQVLGRLEKPDVDQIEGLSPAIAIGQHTGVANPRSTIATVTEIYDYLRVLYATCGQPHDPATGKPIYRYTTPEIAEELRGLPEGTRLMVLAPLPESEEMQQNKYKGCVPLGSHLSTTHTRRDTRSRAAATSGGAPPQKEASAPATAGVGLPAEPRSRPPPG